MVVSTAGLTNSGYTFNGILTGTGGSITVDSNTIGDATANSITIGTSGFTSGICTFNGINNAATGTITIIDNTVQNATLNSLLAVFFWCHK
jgi:hypothetical protein